MIAELEMMKSMHEILAAMPRAQRNRCFEWLAKVFDEADKKEAEEARRIREEKMKETIGCLVKAPVPDRHQGDAR